MIFLALVVAVVVAEAQPPGADPKAPSVSPVTVTKAIDQTRDPDKVTCKTEAMVGTHMRSRICETNRDWERRRQDSRDMLMDIVQRADESPFKR
ncbi:MAG: hypothetical protein ACYDD1_18135 [Caulobacteraceae bacterium]